MISLSGRRDLAAISSRSRRESRRDRGAFLAAEIFLADFLAAISAPRRDHGRDRGVILRRVRGEITARYGKSRWPKSRCDSRRDRSEIWKSRRVNTRRDVAARSRRDTEISAAKTRRDREVISRRDMEILRAVSRGGLGGSLAGIRGEKRNSWRSKSCCYPVGKRNSRQPK